MKTGDGIAYKIRQLEREHRYDRDGGYKLVREILNYWKSLCSKDRKKLRKFLLNLVANKDDRLWGVALESLIQEADPETPHELEKILVFDKNSSEWNDQIILGLIRLGYEKAINMYTAYIESELSRNRDAVLPLLAALVKIDPSVTIKLASEHFGVYLQTDNGMSKIAGYIPAFIWNFIEKDKSLLVNLVEQTLLINKQSGEKLIVMITDYLSKPWVVRNFGQKTVSWLMKEIKRVYNKNIQVKEGNKFRK